MPPITALPISPLQLRGVTAATVSHLRAVVLHESEVPFQLKSRASAPGILRQQILQETGSGLLTFAYQLSLTETDYDAELKCALSFNLPNFVVTFADFRADGTGRTPPDTFAFSKMEGYVFKFNYGLAAGRDSRTFFIATNGREFSDSGGRLSLITGMKSTTLDVAAPLSTAPTRWWPASAPAPDNSAPSDADGTQPDSPVVEKTADD